MICSQDLGLVYRAPSINGDPRLLFPRENLDYAKYYEIKIVPCLDTEELHPIDPIFEDLFHVYSLTFQNFLDYLQAFNDGRAWDDYSSDDHGRYPNVHLHCIKELTPEQYNKAYKIL